MSYVDVVGVPRPDWFDDWVAYCFDFQSDLAAKAGLLPGAIGTDRGTFDQLKSHGLIVGDYDANPDVVFDLINNQWGKFMREWMNKQGMYA